MAISVKISQLVDGGAVNSADYIPVARGSADTFKIPAGQFTVGGLNLGVGTGTVFRGSVDGAGRFLQFRSLSGVDTISIVNAGDTIVVSASGQNPVKNSLIGTGITTTFPIVGANSVNPNNYRVDIDGVLQEPGADYNIVGSNIVFNPAPPNNSKITVVSNNLVRAFDTIPSDGSVSPQKISMGGPFWDTTGNVGVGTPTPFVPLAPLDVWRGANFGPPQTTGTGKGGINTKFAWGGGDVSINHGLYPSGTAWIQNQRISNNSDAFPLLINPIGGPVLIGAGSLTSGAIASQSSLIVCTSAQGVMGMDVLRVDPGQGTGIGGNIALRPNSGQGNNNGMVQAGDQAIIFHGPTVNTGNFCIAPWATATTGLRMLTNGWVGINTPNPVRQLHLAGAGQAIEMVMELTDAQANIRKWNFVADRGGATTPGNPSNFYLRLLNDAVDGGAIAWHIKGNVNNMGIGGVGVDAYKLYAYGAIAGIGAYINASDANIKENIDYNFTYGLDTVLRLKPTKFDYKDKTCLKNNLGFIAQDVQTVLPEVVVSNTETIDGKPVERFSLKESNLIAVLVKAVQELKAELDAVKKELVELKG